MHSLTHPNTLTHPSEAPLSLQIQTRQHSIETLWSARPTKVFAVVTESQI
jgi:hypothetical protein